MKDESFKSRSIQKILNRLISEEWLAGNMYRFYCMSVEPDQQGVIDELFMNIAEDELDEHYTDLVKWARAYGYSVPCGMKEITHHAGETAVRLFTSFRKNQPVEYYVKKVIDAENDAIASYAEALENEELVEYGDLCAIITRNYYDEVEHLEKLGVMDYVGSFTSIQVQ